MTTSKKFHNRILATLSAADRRLLLPHLSLVHLALGQSLEKSNTKIDFVYFLEEGVASVVAIENASKKREIEVGLIGSEGVTGLPIMLGNHRSRHQTYMQAAGHGWRIRAVELRKAMAASATLRSMLLKYVQVFVIQTTHTAVANGRANIPQRLARWILMAHDRLERDTLPLTHALLAIMLGVRRAGVTEAVNILQGDLLIRATRDQITVLDRKGLIHRAKDLYGVPETEYRRLIG